MTIDNDTRGWIMTALSGVACMLGSLVICIDLIIRLIPHPACRSFKIQDSNAFLSSSLSLSFGVMLFSSLRNLLQNAEKTLHKAGFSSKAAAWTWLGCFFAGAAGIQVLARIAHHYMPHQVVDCDHTHEDDEEADVKGDGHDANHAENGHSHPPRPSVRSQRTQKSWTAGMQPPASPMMERPRHERPPLHTHLSQKIADIVTAPTNAECLDEHGQCMGFSDPCGKQCFRFVTGSRSNSYRSLRQSTLQRTISTPAKRLPSFQTPALQEVREDTPLLRPRTTENSGAEDVGEASSTRSTSPAPSQSSSHIHHDHHHHVPENAFLSIGLQTTIAIALHKLPEGFITFATNHANPELGFTVFLALFIHNITEGFTMALPLFLALRSRWKAILWSTALGGLSQPLGAGIAALWFHFAGEGDSEPGDGVYGCMYAVIAGIMASVALQLFSESLDLTHNKGMCLIFAFIGMGILGFTGALTA